MSEHQSHFIGISSDIIQDTFIAVALSALFVFLVRWDDIFTIGTPSTGYFSAEIASLSFSWQFLMVVIIAPIVETMLFLFFIFGFISTILASRGWSNKIAIPVNIIITSALFASFHFAAYGTALQTAYIGAFSFNVMAGMLMLWRRSQIPPIILHAVINAAIFWGAFVIV